ncbi:MULTISPECIES: hypothetical protein [Enterococcus]|uniref:hypothetical protein n=1 Tax=Enterococcus TaxID=1350 RepID=UPI0010942C72|nr:hypothetical protein [Enterococcus hirae]MCR1913711.1 hypothetical protein [Enterococcus hirae]MDL4889474.1 hypothetical protein [Enterococcus hirae]MDL4892104.1 hypothetical protein [Enterococcus hirae]MDL4898220.1 hypothetical protein [Enterococcus hirae]MDL4900802.1 hypothetical protein [Enterococcus hirae]
MEWMNIDKIYKLVVNTRLGVFGKEQNKLVKSNITSGLEKIKELKSNCLKHDFSKQGTYTIELFDNILETEAKILNIIGILSYAQFDKNNDFNTYLSNDGKYAFKEYLESIEYYATDYCELGILPNFYVKYVQDIECK